LKRLKAVEELSVILPFWILSDFFNNNE